MATKNAEEKEVKAPNAAPKAKAPRAPKAKAAAKPKAEPKPQLTKEDIQAAVYEAVKAAMAEVKAAEPKPEVKAEEPKKEIKPVVKTSDEKLMDSLAFINLILGIVGIIALIATGFIVEANRDPYLEGPDLRPILAGVGVVLVLPVLLQYACLRLFTNISHRLSSMDKKMDEK